MADTEREIRNLRNYRRVKAISFLRGFGFSDGESYTYSELLDEMISLILHEKVSIKKAKRQKKESTHTGSAQTRGYIDAVKKTQGREVKDAND